MTSWSGLLARPTAAQGRGKGHVVEVLFSRQSIQIWGKKRRGGEARAQAERTRNSRLRLYLSNRQGKSFRQNLKFEEAHFCLAPAFGKRSSKRGEISNRKEEIQVLILGHLPPSLPPLPFLKQILLEAEYLPRKKNANGLS